MAVGRPLGATLTPAGADFALASPHAAGVDLCLFDADGLAETVRTPLARDAAGVWHVAVPGIRAGQLYGYRVRGPWDPAAGHRFNAAKLLLDPYARRLSGDLRWEASTFPDPGDDTGLDSARSMPKGVVVAPDPVPDTRPRRAWTDLVIYEAHVKGLTRLHPDVPPDERGTFAALGHPAIVRHLVDLGVTALELLPIQAFVDDRFLLRRDLVNYWGYSTLAFFAPERRYGEAAGLKRAVQALHAAGIEVILDVVYNHTAELEEGGPTLAFRGIDNATYYKPVPGDPARTWNITGCGNALNVAHPLVRRLVLDSLRHWVVEYGIDGFRFDLGTILARDPDAFDPDAGFLREVAADPVLADTKLIAEPWDIGPDGYRLGGFPDRWSEWNDQARDAIRRFWRADPGTVPELARALAGSREIAGPHRCGPRWSVNYVASHDGFTLRDAVSYAEKHNEANREDNRDGHDENFTDNGGVEGDTADPAILAQRARQTRNLLATLLVAQGVPMILMGDELSRSQGGNNNAYCQDGPATWLDWTAGRAFDPDLPDFVAALTRLRRDHPALRRERFLDGLPDEAGERDVLWLAQDGSKLAGDAWHDRDRKAFGWRLAPVRPGDAALLVLVNAGRADVAFRVPGGPWTARFRTDVPRGVPDPPATLPFAGTFVLPSRSLVFFSQT